MMDFKRTLVAFFTLLFASSIPGLFAQSQVTQIDFEPTTGLPVGGCGLSQYSQAEFDAVNNAYFGCAYGVTFHLGSLNGPDPVLAQVGGGPDNCNPPSTNPGAFNSSYGADTPAPSSQQPNNANFGNFFLTDDGCLGDVYADGISNVLYVDYDQSVINCTNVSGYLLDVDGGERWIINVYTIGNSSPAATVSICGPGYSSLCPGSCGITGSDGLGSFWSFSNLGRPIDYLEFQYDGCSETNAGLALDNLQFCSSPVIVPPSATAYCCEGTNLIPNGNFEAGDVAFSSDYNSIANLNPVNAGDYAVIHYLNTGALGQIWMAEDHTHCINGGNGNIMVANGETQQASNQTNVIWETNIPIQVTPQTEYRFCGFFKDLSECCINIQPEVLLQYKESTGPWQDITQGYIPVTTNPAAPCDWQELGGTFYSSNSSTVDLRILIKETGNGPGNDLAMDDLSLTALTDLRVPITTKTSVASNAITCTASIHSINTFDDILPSPKCEYAWYVVPMISYPPLQLDFNYTFSNNWFGGSSIGQPWGLTTSFPGVTLVVNKLYRVYFRIYDSDCFSEYYLYSVTGGGGGSGSLKRQVKEELFALDESTILSGENLPWNYTGSFSPQPYDPSWEEVPLNADPQELKVFPNPFREQVTIEVQSQGKEAVEVRILDLLGRTLHEFEPGEVKSGSHTFLWQPNQQVKNGIYLIEMREGQRKLTRKLVLDR